ncbi:MAG: NAD(P)-dependent oxidoreductase [bacterium]
MIAYLGIGLLGHNFVRALLTRGETVHVWNRSIDKARALEQYGAKVFDDPADAVRGADIVHLTLSEDSAVDDVLERARAGFGPNVLVIDHTTTSPVLTGVRAKRWAERGVAFMHAPVFMGPPNALAGTGVMMASGDRVRFDALAPHLEKMTGKLVYLGPDPARAAGMKLLGNHFLIVMGTALMDTLALAKALEIPQDEVAHLFEFFNPGTMIPARLARIRAADYANPSWNLAMARKDVRLMTEAAQSHDVILDALPAIAKSMDEWIAKGHAAEDWTVISTDDLERPAQ